MEGSLPFFAQELRGWEKKKKGCLSLFAKHFMPSPAPAPAPPPPLPRCTHTHTPHSTHTHNILQVERCYTGPQDSELVAHMKACNPRGPLVIYIAKLFPLQDCSGFDAFGRVMSGTVKPGEKVSDGGAPLLRSWSCLCARDRACVCALWGGARPANGTFPHAPQ
jgi:hypothetical protein